MHLDMEPKQRTLAILGFHKVGEPPAGELSTWFYVSRDTFIGFLSYLRESGWNVIDLQGFLTGLAAPESLPERSVLITFDDGYRSMRTVALPLLQEFGFPAVLFVPSAFVGGQND